MSIALQKSTGMVLGMVPLLAGLTVVPAGADWCHLFRETRRRPTYFQPLQTQNILHGAIVMTLFCIALHLLSFGIRKLINRNNDSGLSPTYWRILFSGCNWTGIVFGAMAQYFTP